MKKKSVSLAAMAILTMAALLPPMGCAPDEVSSPDLHTKLERRTGRFRGDVGVFVRHLETGETVSLSKLAFFMASISDNTASLWVQGLVKGTEVNRWLEEHGFEHTRVNSRVEGRQDHWERFGWGQTTPREMAELLVMVREGKAVSPKASERMYRALSRSYWDGEALSALPPTVAVASKQGAVSASRSEVLLVNAPTGDYVLCVITKGQEDRNWVADNEGFVLLRDLSAIVYEHFVQDS
jgi:beta-lactamase class A